MNKNTDVSLHDSSPDRLAFQGLSLSRACARKLIEQAIDIELQEWLSQCAGQQTDSGASYAVVYAMVTWPR